jgi:hypothetical protein
MMVKAAEDNNMMTNTTLSKVRLDIDAIQSTNIPKGVGTSSCGMLVGRLVRNDGWE